MQPPRQIQAGRRTFLPVLLLSVAVVISQLARADQIEMQNGDRYHGKVLSLTNDLMVLQSEILGTVTIPRAKIARIALGASATNSVNSSPKPLAASTNSGATALASLRKAGAADDAEKVKQQFLGDADPAAKAKFDQMLGDLMSGKMTIADLRVEAKSAADQLRGLKKELGPEADATLDTYLTVLENFLREVPVTETVTRTNQPAPSRPKAQADKEN